MASLDPPSKGKYHSIGEEVPKGWRQWAATNAVRFTFFPLLILILYSGWSLKDLSKFDEKSHYSPQIFSSTQRPISLSNASTIFNSVHGALREKHSFLNPVGVTLTPAYIPEGTLLYHGTTSGEIKPGYEWIAMDSEFSYWFIANRGGPNGHHPAGPHPGGPRPGGPHPPIHPKDKRAESSDDHPSLFTLEVVKPLNKMILIDGASASKLKTGEEDTQMILAQGVGDQTFNEREVAERVCKWGEPFGLDGYIRLEVGFEAVICNMKSEKLKIVNKVTIPWKEELLGPREQNDTLIQEIDAFTGYEHLKSGNVHDKRDNRVLLDFRGLATPVNKTWINPDPYLRRTINISQDLKDEMIYDLKEFFQLEGTGNPYYGTNWQLVSDEIVDKFAPLLKLINQTYDKNYETDEEFDGAARDIALYTANFVRRFYVENNTEEAKRQAVYQYSHPLQQIQSDSDILIWSSVTRVTEEIVDFIFENFDFSKEFLSTKGENKAEFESMRSKSQTLLNSLKWSEFYECTRKCNWDEICYTPSWGPSPLGFGTSSLGTYTDRDGQARISETQQCISYRDILAFGRNRNKGHRK